MTLKWNKMTLFMLFFDMAIQIVPLESGVGTMRTKVGAHQILTRTYMVCIFLSLSTFFNDFLLISVGGGVFFLKPNLN
jgi:hypothetical protein